MMRVLVRRAEENVGRLCLVNGWNPADASPTASDQSIETPTCTLYTIAGHSPHLTHDTVAISGVLPENVVYQLTLPTLLDKLPMVKDAHARGLDGGIARFVGLPKSALTYLSYNDPCVEIQSGYNDKSSVSVVNKGGRRRIDSPLFASVQETFGVQCFQAMGDVDTPADASAKRLKKAVDRTETFAKRATEVAAETKTNVFVTLTGGYSETDRMSCIDRMREVNCSGYVFEGFHSFGALDNFEVSSIVRLLTASVNALPRDRLRFFPGALNPAQVLELVRHGVDLFDSSYVHLITEKFLAVLIPSDLLAAGELPFEMVDLKNEQHAGDLAPISKTCGCYTCKSYSRAYLNHLWNTKELLGPILLNLHNLHQYFQMFSNIRRILAVDLKEER